MQQLLVQPRVDSVVSDQCQYGLVTRGSNAGLLPAKKPTRWASTSPQMLSRLSARCPGDHIHQHLVGGRAANAAFHPPELITSILRGMRDTADAGLKDVDNDVAMDVAMTCAGALRALPAHSLYAAHRESDLNHNKCPEVCQIKIPQWV